MSKDQSWQPGGSKLTRKRFLTMMGATATAMVAAPHIVGAQTKKWAGQTLRVQFWPGDEGDAILKSVVDPFKAATGANVVIDSGNTSQTIAKIIAEKNDPQIDVFLSDNTGVYALAPQNLLTKLNLANIPNAKNVDPQFVIEGGTGIAFFTFTEALVYNTNYYKTAPTSYEALWDPKLKGRVALPASDTGDALDLVMIAAKLAGGNQYNVDAGFKKLAELKPNVNSFTTDYAAAGELIKKGDIVLAFDGNDSWKQQQLQGYPIKRTFRIKEGIYTTPGVAAIPKGHPGPQALAELFINQVLTVQAQRGLAAGLWWGPTNRTVTISDPNIRENVLMPDEFSQITHVDVPALVKVRQGWITRYEEALKG